MFAITGKSRFQGFQTGSQAFGGTVYKTWNGGKNGLVIMNTDWDVPSGGGTLTRWQNGNCGGGLTLSNDDGLANTKALFDNSSVTPGQCYLTAGADTWRYTRLDFTYVSENNGYSDWFLPAYNQLDYIYSSSAMPSPTSGAPYFSSTGAGNVGGEQVGWGLRFDTGVWAKYGDSGIDDGRIRLIREY